MENDIKIVVDELGVNTDEVSKMCEHFKLTVEQATKMIDKGDMRSFPSYKEFFVWMHEDSDVYALIDLMWKEENYINDDQVFESVNGTTVFMYR